MGIPLENNRMACAHQLLLHVGPIHEQFGHAAAIAIGCDPLDGNVASHYEMAQVIPCCFGLERLGL